MKKFKGHIYRSFVAILFVLSGCGEFLDINVDPNAPSTVPNSQLLVSSQLALVNSLGSGPTSIGLPANIYVHQIMIRSSFDGYGIGGSDANVINSWQNLYSGALQDLETVIEQGTEKEEWKYVGVAKLLKAYTYSMMVDVWGDIPYSEANKGPEIVFPRFDDDQQIYNSLLTLIDEAIVDVDKANGPNAVISPGLDDLIYGGDLVKWKRFGRTLKLKMLTNMRGVEDVNARVQALVATPADLINTQADDFELRYFNVAAPENRNPAYRNQYNAPSWTISRYFYEILVNKSTLNTVLSGITDPRVPYYFVNQLTATGAAQNPTEYRDGGFLTINFGSQGPNQGFDQSRSQTVVGLYFCGGKFDTGTGGTVTLASGSGRAAQRLLNYYSVLYNRAELAVITSTAENARTLFQDAMRASFAKVNQIATTESVATISDANRDTYVNAVLAKYDAASAAGKLELIMTEKWIANFGNPIDSYSDYRRTGFPKMFDPNTDELSFTSVSRGYPLSFPWRQNDLQINPNAPREQKLVSDSRVFWDAN